MSLYNLKLIHKRVCVVASSFICVFICCFMAFIPVSAISDAEDVVIRLQINNPMMEVNGVDVEIDAGRGTTPVVTDGRTLVPIRAIIEAFDGIVEWDNTTQTVMLSVGDDCMFLTIGNNIAYLNEKVYTLDVAPSVVNGRTMLPIRFIAEGFNIGVVWDGETQTVTLIRNSFDAQEYNYLMNVIPEYIGLPYVEVNDGFPLFKEYEIIEDSFEYYSELDELGRCDVCMASIAKDIAPTEERESISSVTPTGWINAVYDIIPGKYLYNRCHLIGYQLAGENANERNLITGTRYLNIDGMLHFENIVDDYVEQTGNHVMYRVTPVFKDNNLVADGVLLEAYSVEDNGQGVSFCVYCYNVQPNITIDYATGESWLNTNVNLTIPETSNHITFDEQITTPEVYRTPTGKKYHFDAECGGKNSFKFNLEDAIAEGLAPCSKCTESIIDDE